MDRLTRPDVEALQTSARFMGTEIKIQDIGDKQLHLILNGPTINSINKDTLRHLVRQLYTELKRYEDLEMTPEAIEQQLKNFSSFLMEMTGGRMSKTNYTVQAMVSETNNYDESLCDECADRQQMAEVEKELAKVEEELDKIKAERDAALCELRDLSACYTCKHEKKEAEEEPCCSCCNCVYGTTLLRQGEQNNWEWRGAKDTNVPIKED